MTKKPYRSSVPGTLFRILIILIAIGFFAFGGYNMYFYVSDNAKSDQGRDKLANQSVTILAPQDQAQQGEEDLDAIFSPDVQSGQKIAPDLSKTIPLIVDFETLQAEHPEIIGWIYGPDTPINYPIVQGDDNQYYVNHLVDGTPLGSGAIFLDFRNSPDLSDRNSLIYGHNMTNKSMFGSLRNYRNQSYYDENPLLWIVTPEMAYRVDLIAGCVTAADSDDYDLLETEEELQTLLDELIGKSTFKSKLNPAVVERVVVLSTCTYEYDNARYIVIGNLLPIPYPETYETEDIPEANEDIAETNADIIE